MSSAPTAAFRWKAIVILVGLVVLILGTLEMACRLCLADTLTPPPRFPYSDRSEELDIAQLERWPNVCRVSPDHRRRQRRQFFATPKAPGTFRIFVVGSSAVYSPSMPVFQSFPLKLKHELQRAFPEHRIDVINVGVIGLTSARARVIVRQLVSRGYQPDLVVLYEGNNEFRLIRAYKKLYPDYSARVERFRRLLCRSYLYRALRMALVGRMPSVDGSSLPGVENWEQGTVDGEDVVMVREQYQENLEEIVRICSDAAVPLLLCTVPCNETFSSLGIWSPVKEDPGLDPHSRDVLEQVKALEGHPDLARALLEREVRPNSPGYLHGELGLRLRADDCERAKRELDLAMELDPRPYRALPSFRKIVIAMGTRRGVYVCDLVERLERAAPQRIFDDTLFDDACHFTQPMNVLVGRELAHTITQVGLISQGPARSQAGLPSDADVTDVYSVRWWPGLKAFMTLVDSEKVSIPADLDKKLRSINRQSVSPPDEVARQFRLQDSQSVLDLVVAGHILFDWDRLDEAATYYRKAISLSENRMELERNLGDALLYSENCAEALEHYRTFLALGGNDEEVAEILRMFAPVRP